MNNQYDIVSISIKTKPRNERRGIVSRLALQLWLHVNIQSLLAKSAMLASTQIEHWGTTDEMVVTLNMQHKVNTTNNNNKSITTTTEEQQ